MEHRALAVLVVRIAGLWELVVALNAVPSAIGPFINPEYIQKAGPGWLLLNAVFTIGIPLALGLFLIYFPRTVSMSVLRVEGIQPQTSFEASILERVLVSLLGLWFAVQALLDGLQTFSRWHLYRRFVEDQYPGATGPAIGPQEFAGLIVAVAQLALGLWLLLGSRGIVNILSRLRG
jgi:hypothetical protein